MGLFGRLYERFPPGDNPFWHRLIRRPRYMSDFIALVCCLLVWAIVRRPAAILIQWGMLLFLAYVLTESAARYMRREFEPLSADSAALPRMRALVLFGLLRYFLINLLVILALVTAGILAFIFGGLPLVMVKGDWLPILLFYLFFATFLWMYFWSRISGWRMSLVALVFAYAMIDSTGMIRSAYYPPYDGPNPYVVAGVGSGVMFGLGIAAILIFWRRYRPD